MNTRLIGLFLVIILSSLTYAFPESFHVNIQTTDAGGNIVTGTFLFNFTITNSTDCSAPLYTNTNTLTTDSRGIISYTLQNINIPFDDDYNLCYYRDNVLKLNQTISGVPYAQYAKNVTWEGVINRPTNLSQFIDDLNINSSFNQTYQNKADYNFSNNNFNGSGSFTTTNNITADWFMGKLLWTNLQSVPNILYGIWAGNNYNNILISNGTAIGLNGTTLNQSIDAVARNYNETLYINTQLGNYVQSGTQDAWVIKYQNISNIPTCTGNQKLTFDGTTLSCGTDIDTDTQKSAGGVYLYNDTTAIYLNETRLNITILDIADNFNETTYINSNFIRNTSEGNLNVNSSNFWDGLNTPSDISGSIYWYNHTEATFTQYNAVWTSTFNSTYAQFAYNQTTPAINDINTRFWNRTQSYNKTEIDAFNASWSSTFNSTYAIYAYNQTVPANDFTSAVNTSIWAYINSNQASWLSTYNVTYAAKADYQFGNNNFNGSGNFNTTGNISADWGFMKVAWSSLQSVPNIIYGLWTANNANSLLISNGTAIGYNETILNNSISNVGVAVGFNSTFNSTYAQFAYNQTTPANSYTDTQISNNNASWTSTYNVTYDAKIGLGLYINHTPITTTGNITNGTLKGYPAANAICNVYYSGSHMCDMSEIINTINRNVSNQNFTATFRVIEGAPGYLANANDCEGLTSPSGSDLGAIWVGSTSHANTYGSASLVACSAARAIGCCR